MSEIDWDQAPEGYDQAYTTGPSWDGGNRHKDEIRFCRINSSGNPQSVCGAILDVGDSSWVLVQNRPSPAWSGEGLPPVGVVCEVLNSELSDPEWEKCKILFSGNHRVLYDSQSCCERVGYIENLQFRPIRTPEQIAAEEALKEIEILYSEGGPAAVFDAGYRKQEGR